MAIEIKVVRSELANPLTIFFEIIRRAGYAHHFHPHPLTPVEAYRVAHYRGRDLYYVLTDVENVVLGYGMLRGWDEGYVVPSLGIAMHPNFRGFGLGRALMLFLHAVARERGATEIRLKVYKSNDPAIALYRQLGYHFEDSGSEQMIGTFKL